MSELLNGTVHGLLRKYKGFWKNGKQHGEGEFFNINTNSWRKGEWEEGKRIRWIDEEVEEEN